MVGAQDTGGVLKVLLVHGDGVVEPARIPVDVGEVETRGQDAEVVRTQDAHDVVEDPLVQGDGLLEPASIPVGGGEVVA